MAASLLSDYEFEAGDSGQHIIEGSCNICLDDVYLATPGYGIRLSSCLHIFCRECIQMIITRSSDYQIRCPVSSATCPSCPGYASLVEIRKVVSPEDFGKYCSRAGHSHDAVLYINSIMAKETKVNPTSGEFGELPQDEDISNMVANILRTKKETGHPKKRKLELRTELSQVKNDQEDYLDLKLCSEIASCSLCTLGMRAWEGIVLQVCLHVFCKECLRCRIDSSDGTKITCPIANVFNSQSQCNGFVLQREIKSLATTEMYSEYLAKSEQIAFGGVTNLYPCNKEGCSAKFSLDMDVDSIRKVILCSVCNSVNCIKCNFIHEGLECEQFQRILGKAIASGINVKSYIFGMMLDKERNDGFHHLQDNLGERMAFKGNANMKYEDAIEIMEKMDFIMTSKEFECAVCFNEDIKEGIVLQECLHKFCRECIRRVVETSEEPEIMCPLDTCQSLLHPREIKAIVSPALYEEFLNRSVTSAERRIPDSFHCMTADCTGWCIVEETANIFCCPVCDKQNCLRCKLIHDGLSCKEFEQKLLDDKNRQVQLENERIGEREVENLVTNKTYMRCPHCKMVCQKISGCNHVVCGSCKQQFNWRGI